MPAIALDELTVTGCHCGVVFGKDSEVLSYYCAGTPVQVWVIALGLRTQMLLSFHNRPPLDQGRQC